MTNEETSRLERNDFDIDTIVQKLEKTASVKEKALFREAIEKMKEGSTLYESLRLTPDMLEVIYQHGYQLFQSGKYKEALSTFRILQTLHPEDKRYPFAIAAALHFEKNYVEAAAYYMIYASMDRTDPIPFYHLYDCFLKEKHPTIAENALDEAYRLAKGNPKYHDLKEKIELELKHIESKDSEIKIHKEIKG